MRKTLLLFISFIFCWCVYAENYPSLRDILNSQINNSVIDIPKGTYVLDLVNIQDAYAFRNKKNVIINGNGSTIICNRQSQAFYFENCENLTFSNFFIHAVLNAIFPEDIVTAGSNLVEKNCALTISYPLKSKVLLIVFSS